ncbi:MAG: hypothetical protein A4E35_02137 [Methanoregula sp. PtaU1.Bin051]|nr:MAG: hypothetical protein A4E35_02137 [Methanoregula sp. PtaU1.Bin051]
MTYLVYVAAFGAASVIFLWLRDARIYYRTGLPGYRLAAYWGVLYSALASFGLQVTVHVPDFELLGLGLVLLAMYLLVNRKKEKVWTNEGTLERFLGSVPIKRANKR